MKAPAALNELLNKPMDRKQFLQHTAAITLFIAGGGAIMQSLVKGFKLGQNAQPTSFGYGASSYGGLPITPGKK
jgi:hypothetical protein